MIPHKCPVCDGQGTVSRPPKTPGDQPQWTDDGFYIYPCRVCCGGGIVWEGDAVVTDPHADCSRPCSTGCTSKGAF